MRRLAWWLAGAAVVAWAAVVAISQFGGHGLPWWFGSLPFIVFALLVAVRLVRELVRPASGRPARSVLGPGAQGLDEVQGIELGRPPGLVVTYGDDEPPETELVVPRSDDLDRGPWTVVRRPDGGVVIDTGAPGDDPGPATGARPDRPAGPA